MNALLAISPDVSQWQFAPFRKDDLLLAFIGQIGIAHWDQGAALCVDCAKGAANPAGTVHGGALSSLFDVALYEAAKCKFDHALKVVTISLDVKFLRPANPEKRLFIVANVLRAGRILVSCAGNAFQEGRIVAHASGQFVQDVPKQSPIEGFMGTDQ